MLTRLRPHLWPIAALILLPVAASALFVLGLRSNNPADVWSSLTTPGSPTLLGGPPGYWDASIGLLTQPLARLSASDWLRGVVPWWNPYTGIGMPLAAEMQTLSFFLPFVLIMKYWQGWFVVKLLMQVIAGLGTYALMLQIGCRRTPGLVSAGLFALNGAFLMEPHAMGSLAFLPLILLGIERSAAAARSGAAQGWHWIVFGLAYSLYGGYPEVAYLDGLLAAAWTLARFATLGAARWRFAGKIILAVIIGLALALPLVVPFLNYAAQSYLGAHKAAYAVDHLPPMLMPLALFPLIYGPTGIHASAGWVAAALPTLPLVKLGGWFGLTAVIPALAALLRARTDPARGLIIGLGMFLGVGLARCYGVPGVAFVLNAIIPDLGLLNTARFLWPALSMAVFVLAGIGLDRCVTCTLSLRQGGMIGALLVAVIAAVILPDRAIITGWYHFASPPVRVTIVLGTVFEGLAGLVILAALAGLNPVAHRHRARMIAAAMLLDAFVVAALPQLSAPRPYRYYTGGIAYLKAHLGLARVYSLRPFGPDYPAGYRLASIDDSQLPVSQAWSDYIRHHLDPYDTGMMFVGWWKAPPGSGQGRTILFDHVRDYAAIGVKYVITSPGQISPFLRSVSLPHPDIFAGAAALGAGDSRDTTLAAGQVAAVAATLTRIDHVAVLIGTYDGSSTGILSARLCAGALCAGGTAPLATAQDDAWLNIPLHPAIDLTAGAALHLRLTHVTGAHPVALWLRRSATGVTMPALRLSQTLPGGSAMPVYHDPVMSIFRIRSYHRYFSATPACRLSATGRDKASAECATPAILTRQEAWFPGWRARLNGRAVPVARHGALFQSVALPAGRSSVTFSYRPRGTRLSVTLAGLALALWAGCTIRPYRAFRRRALPHGGTGSSPALH
ncbi:MAG: hypothetical protein B7Z58_11345 [Acidiphilium sp. 37-64-53]|uniref:hypothetical protein n=1 Tax=Acidiphilium TaxID=522 RepID=UPI000BD4C7DC|nr:MULTISPECIES: hypothetical protein [Acidiphilium]OYW01452.1 MAG: hypothetical protein B7Z58_11345 [Acidiphilium sp. 37-64-53]OZB30627.1 MAG: hypothetical protein B7X49_02280 [Acidiphilium sp. 34-64-41]HQT83887.1 hypothetical protein [Acidiphilium rubrum]